MNGLFVASNPNPISINCSGVARFPCCLKTSFQLEVRIRNECIGELRSTQFNSMGHSGDKESLFIRYSFIDLILA
ncbi:hypothetical protein CR513_51744, partial [Mucuna pruriens]